MVSADDRRSEEMTPANESHSAEAAPGALTLPGQPSATEQWMWQRVCEGAIADFNVRDGKVLDPSDATGWDDTRTVSSTFLETVLLQEPYRSALPRQGVCIVGAWFEAALVLEDARLGHTLWLDRARFQQDVQLSGLESIGSLSLEGSYFARSLAISLAQIEGQLVLRGTHCTDRLDLSGARIGSRLVLTGAHCIGLLDLPRLEVKRDMCMDTEGDLTAQFAAVDLSGAHIGGYLNLNGAQCTGRLDLTGLDIKDGLFMTAQFAEVDLSDTQIEGKLDLTVAHCTGPLNLRSLHVAGHVLMSYTEVAHAISLIFARIDGSFHLFNSQVASLDLTGASLQGELHLGAVNEDKSQWAEDAQLVLRNTTIGALQCPPSLEAWPALELSGCTYRQLGGISQADSGTEMADRSPAWFIDWLEKDRTFSPQPYHQLVSVLRTMGHAETADAVLFASKERERGAAGRWTPKWWGMSLLKWTIGYGYGYRYFYALWWVLGITLLGVLMLETTSAGQAFSLAGKLAYSFDLLLPIIELDKRHSLEAIDGWQRYYFYVHKLLGYVLGSFIVAGLAGLTKK
jgi:uncharacterized protein YjbI with pentapeptide repeats